MKRERIFFLLVMLFCLAVVWPIGAPLVSGMIMAFLCEGPTEWIEDRFSLNAPRYRWLLAFVVVTLVQCLFIVPLSFLSWSATTELINFYEGYSGDVSAAETVAKVGHWLDRSISPHLQSLGLPIKFAEIQEKLSSFIQPALKSLMGWVAGLLSSTPELVLFLVISWMSWIYFLVYGHEQRRYLLPKLMPWKKQRAVVANTLAGVLRALVLTSIVLSLIQSLLVLLTLGIFGIPKFYLWAALAFFLSFVPVFGTAPIMLCSAIYAYTHGQSFATVCILLMSVVIGLIDNIIRPLLMKGSSELSFFWLFLAIVGGVSMFGVAGAILGPWAFALFLATKGQDQVVGGDAP